MSVTQSATPEAFGTASGTAAIESVGGIVAVVLTILGLAHVAPVFLVAIATIAVGAALLADGAALVAGYARLLTGRGEQVAATGASPTWSIELLAGSAGIVLGILALLNVQPLELVAIAAIAFGGGLILTSSLRSEIAVLRAAALSPDDRLRHLAAEGAAGSAVAEVLTGLAAVVLGILALAGLSQVTLVLVALLAVGVFLVLSGSTAANTMVAMFRR
jgi:hypothetical protein